MINITKFLMYLFGFTPKEEPRTAKSEVFKVAHRFFDQHTSGVDSATISDPGEEYSLTITRSVNKKKVRS